ncbi:hypothetical protein [Sabulicella glaciei]|uniref:Uncharacterized protein n=1 Tax=Sabulicella glaciei TaxID=2984948 RepID=A0ABT3NXA4_9PROT|nr:hypothetical protein [Roseococcus sp. MDT2-1-1]MCW8086789.1 hypothetical protein [Roseococcus sp. MDT2-1-1]
MKSVLTGIVIAVLIAVGAAFVLDGAVQRPVQDSFTTQGVRL